MPILAPTDEHKGDRKDQYKNAGNECHTPPWNAHGGTLGPINIGPTIGTAHLTRTAVTRTVAVDGAGLGRAKLAWDAVFADTLVDLEARDGALIVHGVFP